MAYGHGVLAGAGGVVVDNVEAKDPMPQFLIYVPLPSSSPADWLDFDGPDDPYRLIGWVISFSISRAPAHRAAAALRRVSGSFTKQGGTLKTAICS